MRTSLVLALTAALGGIASAQPGPPPQPPPPPMDTTMPPPDPMPPDPEPDPMPQPQPQPQPQPMMQPMPQPVEEANGPVRPDALSIALGAGYALPTSLETPNITSARLRLPSGLTFEPALRIQNTSSTQETPIDEQTDKQTVFALAALVRFPVVSRGRVDLELLASAGFANTKTNPEGDYNTTTVNSFDIGYGLAIAYWFSRHWNLTFNVTNPIVAYDSSKQQIGPGMSTTDSGTTIGLIFVPQVFMMLHLYN